MTNTTDTTFVDLDNSRLDEQRKVMEHIIDNAECPFCLGNLKKYHKQPILKEGKFWIITPNQWPYENTKLHLLAIYKTHAETLSDMDPAAGEELIRLFSEIETEQNIPGGAFSVRFGNTNYSAGSVKHLHAQLFVPDITKENFEPVRIKIGKNKEKET